MAKLTYFNIIMLCGLLTAYNMQAADVSQEAAQGLGGIAQAAQLVQVLADTAKQGYSQGAQDAAKVLAPTIRSLEEENLATQAALAAAQTFGGSLSGLGSSIGQGLSSGYAAVQTKLAPYTQAAQAKLAPVWARVQPYTGYVTGPVNTLASSLARAATATGGAITGGVAGGLERLTTKAGVHEWLNSAAAQQYLQNNFPNVLATLQKVDEQTYQMILGGVALAVGTYLAGRGLAAGYNYFKGEPIELQVARLEQEQKKLIQEANRLYTKAVSMPETTTLEFDEKQKTAMLAEEIYTKAFDINETINQLLTAQAKAAETAAQPGLIGKAYAKLPGVPSLFTKTPSLVQQIADLTTQHDRLLAQAKSTNDKAKAEKLANEANAINNQIQQLAANKQVPQPTSFFGRMRAKLPSMPSMPSWFTRAQKEEEKEGRAFFTAPSTKSYTNLSELQQLKQAQAELERLVSSNTLTFEEKVQINKTKKAIQKQITKIEAQQPTVEQPTVEQPTGWRTYLPGWLSTQKVPNVDTQNIDIQRRDFDFSEFEPAKGVESKAIPVVAGATSEPIVQDPGSRSWMSRWLLPTRSGKSVQPSTTPVATQEPTVEQPAGLRSYLRIPSFVGGWWSKKPVE